MQPKIANDFERCVTCGGPTLDTDPVVELVADEDETLTDPSDPENSPVDVNPIIATFTMRRCAECRALAERGARLADAHPFLVAKYGYKEHVGHMFEQALTALVVGSIDLDKLGQILAGAKGGRAAALLIHGSLKLRDLGAGAAFGGWMSPRLTLWAKDIMALPPKRWQHLTTEEVAQLREAGMQYRLRLLEHEVEVPVPESSAFRGCLYCGVASVTASSVAAHNGTVWTPIGKGLVELGGRSAPGSRSERLSGHICPACAAGAGNAAGHH
jgi:hypothetical protein